MSRLLGLGGSKKGSAQPNQPTTAPGDRKRDKFLQFLKPHPGSPSPKPPSPALQQAAPHVPSTSGGNDLWTKAYHKLPDELQRCLGAGAADKLQILQDILQTAIQAKEAYMANQLKLKWGNKEINVQETADRLVGWITKFKEVGDIAVQYDPVHATLPWAGVRFILLLVVGEEEKLAAAIVGMERIAVLIGRCAIFEQLYLTSNAPKAAKEATEDLRRELLALYTAILQALCRLIRVFQGKLIDKLKTPESTLTEIRAIDEPESAVNSAVMAVESCYNSATREDNRNEAKHNREELYKLRELLNDFTLVISRTDKNVDDIYKDIEANKRATILQWFSTVPYQSHHDYACEGRVEHTGTWLFKREEFTRWENSKTPGILWLHGIPGAGKTKLVSATTEYLNGTAQFDKVAFFYCKRDEADRRDREKILLSLIKQLACPPIDTKTGGRTRICAEVLEAYNKEQEDPSSRRHLNFDSSLHLLGRLVECFRHPAVVLDALDECSEEVRSDLLRGLLSVIRIAKCPFKVLISSRHNLDIENHLRGLPHVCIDTRDNAQDIENYVRQQLTLRVQDKRLLQGNVSQKLSECIEEVILRDANGMFLWVDWQLRDLCKLLRESDIRTRLGKLPKGLTGVYDEIMDSIKAQPSCNYTLSTHALMWMLVSKRPLTPTVLIAAAELNPPRSISTQNISAAALSQESALAVELLIQSCEGLLLLDKQLNLVRFSHLSVQEYLETRNEIWDVTVIDAQLFVSESCLWALQAPLELPLYKYAAFNWFQHCRSYQDLVLSAVNLNDPKYELSIPLLDTFLGSFEHPSASYVKWVDWMGHKSETYNSGLRCVRSTPLCPAFSAAFAGLGELVSWLWNSEGNDMIVQNDNGGSLLDVACLHGEAWIVAEMLKWGFEINDYQNALIHASEANNPSIIKLLLDQGADPNFLDVDSVTALGMAAYYGRLEAVTSLLDRGADVNLTLDIYGTHTALDAATYAGSLEIATLLLDRGADVNLTGGDYGTALGAAANGGKLELAKLLLDRGADINLTGGYYGTALGAAAYWGRREVVILLLDRGADVNLTGGKYGTALGAAAYQATTEVVILLLDRGADVNLTGGDYHPSLGCGSPPGSGSNGYSAAIDGFAPNIQPNRLKIWDCIVDVWQFVS